MADNEHRATSHTAPQPARSAKGEMTRPAVRAHGTGWGRRLALGAACGVLATVAMSVLMLAGVISGIAPMPTPIPAALIARTLSPLPMPLLLALAATAHLAYGAGAGAGLVAMIRQPRLWRAVGYAVLLWVLMGLVWLPYLGCGPFGVAVTPAITAATVLLHLIYGTILGLLLRQPR